MKKDVTITTKTKTIVMKDAKFVSVEPKFVYVSLQDGSRKFALRIVEEIEEVQYEAKK